MPASKFRRKARNKNQIALFISYQTKGEIFSKNFDQKPHYFYSENLKR